MINSKKANRTAVILAILWSLVAITTAFSADDEDFTFVRPLYGEWIFGGTEAIYRIPLCAERLALMRGQPLILM
jgi:hypothetical protein